ncbi:MAG: 4Fe-4S ferredoxin [Gallionellales bacterium GWA2_60_142]|nr:MAG: 4Fe-4S ferredoxin [Gallionellales bacterium GWA2_60_142]HCI15181.1 4Fe-4S ferredoxin [Gallionellaceae bacterium]
MLKKIFPTLGRFRFTVQIVMLFVTVYGGALLGSYTVDRISQALPSLSCAFDKTTGDHCILIVSQHQLHHRIGEALVKAQEITLKVFVPTLISVATFFAFFFFLNKAFCGWVCPMGTVQELLYRIGRRLGRPLNRFSPDNVERVRPVKWLMLLVLALGLPLMAGMGFAANELGDPYCQVCPSRLATTLLTADTEQIAVRTGKNINFFLGALGNAMFGFVVIAALAARQPFCRICPLLSWNAMFQRLSPMRLVKQQHDKCEKCGVCEKACPMDIHEIGREHGKKAFHEDCTLCGRCAEYCPDDDVIQIKFFGIKLFGSSREYYKQRVKQESPEGMPKNRVIWLKQAK